jgi:quinol monooxygenase YgiN
VTVVVGGWFRLRPSDVDALRPAMEAVLTATRAEDGCELYSYSEDVLDPGFIRIFEIWRDMAALDAHSAAPHIAAWKEARAKFDVSERRVIAYEVASQTDI